MSDQPRGFLRPVELLAVIFIVGVLAANNVVRIKSFARSAAASEVDQTAPNILAGISAYSQMGFQDPTATVSMFTAANVTPDLSGAREISRFLPTVTLSPNSHFDYAVNAAIATTGPEIGNVVYCIVARGRSSASVPGGIVLYSSTPSTKLGWAGHANKTPYINGLTQLAPTIVAGGYCDASGAVSPIYFG